MGHHAKSLALREAPSAFAKEYHEPRPELPRNRLTIEERRPPARTPFTPKMQPKSLVMARSTKVISGKRLPARRNEKKFATKYGYEFQRGLKTAKMLTVSEFDSGLPPLKKRKMK